MNKIEFKAALRSKLMEIPLETRQSWNEADQLGWWGQAKYDDPDLTLNQSRGDIWQHVKIICRNLIGEK